MNPAAQEKIDRLQPILETLIYAAQQSDVAVSGFVIGANPPMMLHFGNIRESGDLEKLTDFHLKVVEMYVERAEGGDNVQRVNLPPIQ